MKKFAFFLAMIWIIPSCNNQTETTTAAADKPAAEQISFPLDASYSKDFEIGDPELGKKVLELWVQFDNNELDKGIANFADSVRIEFPDGSVMEGPRDSILAATKAFRSTMGNVKSSVAAWTVLKPKDKGETWVCIWGKEISEQKNGKIDSTFLQENWRFNTAGKIDLMFQFARRIPK